MRRTARPAATPAPSRRTVLRTAGAGAAGLLGGAALAGCGVPSAYVAEDRRSAADRSARDRLLRFSNWTLYIDVDDKNPNKRPTLDAFSKETGIKVAYTEEINDNDEFFGKISPALMNGQDPERDLVVISDWMASRYVTLGWVQTLDKANLPHVVKNLDPQLRHPAFDPERAHSVPWQSGITGIAYNRKKLGRELKSSADLWAADLKGRVTLFSGMDEALALLLLAQGSDIARFTADDYHRVVAHLQKMVDTRHIRRFTGNDYTKDLTTGDVLACQAYSGDVIQLQADNPDIEFVVPEEGGELWSESLMIPNRAEHKRNAERLIDYYYRPEVAAELAAWVNYLCPVPAAQAVLADSDDEETAELADDPLIFPTAELRRRLHVMRDITAEERPEFHRTWDKIVGL
ncbi:polyamine ABC transporter substrate-binding protein [Peterkaempfera bronchialis]|uniref:polyamine ABC transporter substrate-binding protein n=1 Tax=Peterkaempfera bronchialis TaxID=2126346 RepID=UPI003C2F3FFE